MAEENKMGNKIRTLREALGLTQEELSERCGCELSLIQNLESGEAAASLAPLIKITRALGVRLGTLMDDDTEIGPVYMDGTEMAAGTHITSLETKSDAGDLRYFSLAAGRASRHIDPFIITVEPSGELDHHLRGHEGEEFLYGLEGQIEIEYGTGDKSRVYVLSPGESIYYDSIVPHQVRAHDNQKAKFLAVVYTPV